MLATPTLPASSILLGAWDSLFARFSSAFLAVLGSLVLAVAIVAILQTRRWPRAKTTRKPKKRKAIVAPAALSLAPAPPTPVRVAPPPRPSATTDLVRLRFPGIAESHPDVWAQDAPLDVFVVVDRARAPASAAVTVSLERHRAGSRQDVGRVAADDEGRARFAVAFDQLGEEDLVARLEADGRVIGQAVRAVRIVDYRAEIVETFEDFVAWASGQFKFVDKRHTAREFVDRYADGRGGVPTSPLETIADLYEVANYSEHPVDRSTYLRMVDAFLELERVGALEGPGDK